MSISVGESLPSATFKHMTESGLAETNTEEVFAGKKVILFSVPGAFTPTCHKQHLPSYIESAGQLRSKGIDSIVCLSVNDPFVMKEWSEVVGAGDAVTMLPDWDASFTTALGLTMDAAGAGLGVRGQRFVMVVDNKVVKSLEVEEDSGKMVTTGANTCLANL